MKFYSCVVKCATCGKELAQAANVPEDQLYAAATAASAKAFCPGHSRNANLDFPWREVPAPAQHAATVAAPAAAEEVVVVEDETPDGPRNAEGILLSDLAAIERGEIPTGLPQ